MEAAERASFFSLSGPLSKSFASRMVPGEMPGRGRETKACSSFASAGMIRSLRARSSGTSMVQLRGAGFSYGPKISAEQINFEAVAY